MNNYFKVPRTSFLILSLILSLHNNGFTQTRNEYKGVIVDQQKKPISYATIQLKYLSIESKKLVTYSNPSGNFHFAIDTGSYIISISHTSFKNHSDTLIQLLKRSIPDTFVLQDKIQSLKDVTVTAQKPLVQQMDDRLVYNLSADPQAKSEFATDIMRKVPMLSVDGEGNVKLNGQTNFKVLLNGRETSIFATNLKQALQSFPGSIIERIEVINNPSAKYDAEGVGGIINIVTVKKILGYSANVYSAHSTLGDGNLGGSLNLKKGKTGVYLQASQSSWWKDLLSSSSQITTTNQPSLFTKRVLEGNMNSDRYSSNINGEVSFALDSLHTLSIFGSLGNNNNESALIQDIRLYLLSNTITSSSLNQQNTLNGSSHGYGFDLQKRYKNKPQQELSFRFNALTGDYIADNRSIQEDATNLYQLHNTNDYTNREYTFQIDYVKPIEKVNLEMGTKAIWRNGNSDYTSMFRTVLNVPFIKDPFNSNIYEFTQNVYGAYISMSKTVKKGRLRSGLRVEHTEVASQFLSNATSVDQSYTTLIPNLNLSHRINKVWNMQFSYNLRVQRPSVQMLNPFVRNNDSLVLSYGNPSLGIQKLHSFTWQNNFNANRLFAGVFFSSSYTNDKIVQYPIFKQSSGVTEFTYGNAGREWMVSINGQMNYQFKKPGAQIGVSYGIRYNSIINMLNKEQKNAGISFSGSSWFNYPLGKDFSISGSGYFSTGQYDLINRQLLNWGYQVNIAKQFLQKKIRASINFNNMHAQNFRFTSVTENNRFKTETNNYNPYRVVYLVLSYTFGKLREQGAKARGIRNDDQLY